MSTIVSPTYHRFALASLAKKGSPRLQRVVTVKGIARPEIDVNRLARLLVDPARKG